MRDAGREELIEKIVEALIRARLNGFNSENTARAMLAVAEPVIREECARMAEKRVCMIDWCEETGVKIAAAIREGGKDA